MENTIAEFYSNRTSYLWPLAKAFAHSGLALVSAGYAGLTTHGIAIAGFFVWTAFRQAVSALAWYRHDKSLVEVLDYCVIDFRYFKEWVCWQDVREIVVLDSGFISLRVDDEDKYARIPKCFCRSVSDFLGLAPPPKLILSPIMLNCSFWDLLAAVRTASRPYEIPIRREAATVSETKPGRVSWLSLFKQGLTGKLQAAPHYVFPSG
jgi:hypothetical protein